MIHGFLSMATIFDEANAALEECVVGVRKALR